MSDYTAGPWKMEYDAYGWYDCMSPGFKITAGENEITTIDLADYPEEWNADERQFHPKESEANARLIAAAPRMFEAIRALDKAFPTMINITPDQADAIREIRLIVDGMKGD
jgi:hypothetical protein